MVDVKRKKHTQYKFGSWDWQNLKCEGKQNQAIFFAVLLHVGFEFFPGRDFCTTLFHPYDLTSPSFPLSEQNICITGFSYTAQIGHST